jgi:hypothetical protein
MSMSTHIVGFRPADQKWKEMKAIWDACNSAGVDLPKAVYDFFDGEHPADKPGAEVDLKGAVKEWSADERDGYELDLSKLPPDVKFIRFYNAY